MDFFASHRKYQTCRPPLEGARTTAARGSSGGDGEEKKERQKEKKRERQRQAASGGGRSCSRVEVLRERERKEAGTDEDTAYAAKSSLILSKYP